MQCPHCKQSTNSESKTCEHCGKELPDVSRMQAESSAKESEAPPRKISSSKNDSEPPPRKPGNFNQNKDKGEEDKEELHRSSQSDREQDKKADDARDSHEEDSDQTKPKKKNNNASTWAICIALAFIILLIIQQFKKEPPVNPPPPVSDVNVEASFFNIISGEIAELNRARYYFRAAGMLRLANESTGMPESARYQPVAENYAKALEHFKHVKKVMEEAPRIDNASAAPCRKAFAEIADRYATSADIFNEYAKNLNKDETDRAERAPLTDAQAKYEIADQLMSAFLMEGCKGEYFKFIQGRSEAEKKQAYSNYQNFYGDRFPAIQSTIQNYFAYTSKPVVPTASPTTLPSAPLLPQ